MSGRTFNVCTMMMTMYPVFLSMYFIVRRHIRLAEILFLSDVLRFTKQAMEQRGVYGYKGSTSPDSGNPDDSDLRQSKKGWRCMKICGHPSVGKAKRWNTAMDGPPSAFRFPVMIHPCTLSAHFLGKFTLPKVTKRRLHLWTRPAMTSIGLGEGTIDQLPDHFHQILSMDLCLLKRFCTCY